MRPLLSRSWGILLRIWVLTGAVPGAVLRAIIVLEPGWSILAMAGLVAVVSGSIGFGASAYALLHHRAGQPVGLGEALRYGLRRSPRLAFWHLIAGSLVAGGALLVVASPGAAAALTAPIAVYLLAALALTGPAVLFERGNPLMRSIHLLHGAFGRVARRVLSASATAAVAAVVAAWVSLTAGPLAGLAVGVALGVPVAMVSVTAILVTYIERREAEWGGPLALAGAEC